MNDYKNFLKNNQDNDNIISTEKNANNNALMYFSLKNISTTYNSQISNNFKSFRSNGIRHNIEMNDIPKQKFNEITFKTSNNYYNKKDYTKYLNIPQSNDSTCCDSKYKFYSKNHSNKENIITNLNSNLKENNIYNKLKINELIEITQKRKKLIEEKKRLEEIKKLKISLEEEKLLNIINIDDNNMNININKNCDNGVQTSLIISKNKIENNNENKNNYNYESNDDIKYKIDKNTIENDLVNIGNDTEENKNQDLIFDIEVNDNNFNKKEKLKCNESFENNKENSYSSSNNENEISKVEEYDINKEYLKNETRSDIQDYIDVNDTNNEKEKINIKLNKCKSVTSIVLNRYEDIDIKNSDNLYSMNKNKNNKDEKTNININNKEIELIFNKMKYSYSIRNLYGKKKLYTNLSQNEKLLNKIQIIPLKEQNNNNIKSESNRTKKKRQIDNYAYYYKLKEKNKNH